MSQTHVSTTPIAEGDAARAERASRWSGRRITVLVIGVLLALLALTLVGSGATALWAEATQREAGYVTTDVHTFSTAGAALATEPTQLGSPGVGWLYSPGMLGKVRIRVTPVGSGAALFAGIGPSAEVDRYLTGVNHTVISEFFKDTVHAIDGGPVRAAPGKQRFWVASDTGPSPTVVWEPSKGSWTAVVMNADGRRGIDIGADLGARMPAVVWIAIGVLAAGALFLAGGGLLIASAVPGRRDARTTTA